MNQTSACPQCGTSNARHGDYCMACRWPFPGTAAWDTYQQTQALKSRKRARTMLLLSLGIVGASMLAILLVYGLLAPSVHLPGLFD